MNKKGQGFLPYIAVGALVLIAAVVAIMAFGSKFGLETDAKIGNGGSDSSDDGSKDNADPGVIVESLTVFQTNKHTKATEGSNDVEFWDKGAEVSDTSLSPRETMTLSSGSVTDTSVPSLRSNFGPTDMDLYVEGGSAYYDEKVSAWSIEYNDQTGKGVLVASGPSGSVIARDVGTISDIDEAEEYDTGFVASGTAGTINYSNATGDGSVYLRFKIGNEEPDSELQDLVLCIGDADSDLEGDEITSFTITQVEGQSVGDINQNLLPLFTQAAGTGSYVCTDVGDVVGLSEGEFQMNFVFADDLDLGNEEFEIGVDDNDGWKAREYPSSNLKAPAEDVTIQFVA